MIGIYTFKAGKGLTVDKEAYLVAGAIAFWIMSFFKKSYETALESFHSRLIFFLVQTVPYSLTCTEIYRLLL